MQNKIVVRYTDGRLMKGITGDFMPNKDRFHVVPLDAPGDAKPVDVPVRELKAVFFVKDYAGKTARSTTPSPSAARSSPSSRSARLRSRRTSRGATASSAGSLEEFSSWKPR